MPFITQQRTAGEPLWRVHVLAFVLVEHIAPDVFDVDIGRLDVVAAAGGRAALKGASLLDVVDDGAPDIAPGDVANLELARVAVLAGPARVVLALPGKEGLLAQALNHDVLHDNVLGLTHAAATTVGGVAARDASPGLDVGDVGRVSEGDVAGVEAADKVVALVVLGQGADGDALAILEDAVVDADVGRVHLGGDGVVAIPDIPAAEGDAVGPDGVAAVRVERIPLAVGDAADVNVVHLNILGVGDGHGPHLALHEAHALDRRVGELVKVDVHGPSRQVALALGPVVPDLAVAVERARVVAVPDDAVAAKIPHRRLVLEADGHGHGEPVVDVGGPEHAAELVDVNVLQASRRHVRLDVVRGARQGDEALGLALLEGRGDGGRVVAAVGVGHDLATSPPLAQAKLAQAFSRGQAVARLATPDKSPV